MANFNHGHFISEALTAIFSQSLSPTEVIIVDDASTDNSIEVIQGFAKNHPQIKLLRNQRNMGNVYSSQLALMSASGEFLIGQGADDRILPGFIEKSVAMLLKYPAAGLCCSDPTHLEDETNSIIENSLEWRKEPGFLSPTEFADIVVGGYIPGHTSVYRRELFMQTGGYLPDLEWHSDWFINLVIGFRHGICYIPESLALLRIRRDSYSAPASRSPERQMKVLASALSAVKMPAYRDVLPLFIRSGAFFMFLGELVNAVNAYPELWDPVTLQLTQPNAWGHCQRLDQHRQAREHIRSTKDLQDEVAQVLNEVAQALTARDIDRALDLIQSASVKYPQVSTINEYREMIAALKQN